MGLRDPVRSIACLCQMGTIYLGMWAEVSLVWKMLMTMTLSRSRVLNRMMSRVGRVVDGHWPWAGLPYLFGRPLSLEAGGVFSVSG